MSGRPFLSVVMPVHDGAEWIEATLDSVAGEPTSGVEFIVIDSSQDDVTAGIVERYANRLPLRLLRRPELKPWQTKTNMGVELSSADHACILHQDDLWLPGRIVSVRRWFAKETEAVLHLGPALIIDCYGRVVGKWTCPLPTEQALGIEFFLRRLLVQNFISVPAPVFRRNAWLQCGGMDEQLWYTPDWDMWAKLSGAGPVVYHNEVTTAFRVHRGSLTVVGSHDRSKFREQMQIVLDRNLVRLPAGSRGSIERIARASINVNVALAAASGGNLKALASAAKSVLSLGPLGMSRYVRDSRLRERVASRLRAKVSGAF